MRKLITATLALASLCQLPLRLNAETQTVTGTVVSLSCYFSDKKNIGKAGMLCELATVKYEGNPVGIVTEDGKVYQLAGDIVANNNAKVVPLLSKVVRLTGDVTQKAGISVLKADEATVVDK